MSMLGFLKDIETNFIAGLNPILDFITTFAQGASIIGVSFTGTWFIYKSLLIISGFSQEPFLETIKSFLIKVAIFTMIATGGTYYKDNLATPVINTTIALAEKISGSKELGIFGKAGQLLDNVTETMVQATELKEQQKQATAANQSRWQRFKKWMTTPIGSGAINDIVEGVMLILKLMVIAAGAVYLAIVSFLTVFTSRIFAYVAIAVGPIFFMFAAFEATKNWFWTWLSSTIGYLFTFVSVFIVWGYLLKLTSGYFYSFNGDIFTWLDTFKSFFACVFLAAVVSRIGDLSSSWFSAGNITDGTNAVFAASGYKFGSKFSARMKEHRKHAQQRKSDKANNKKDKSEISEVR